jgi:hypothetical protein
VAKKIYLFPADRLSLEALRKIFNEITDARKQAASDVEGVHKDVTKTT